ncbi:MAG: hypothetical protein ACYS5V_03360, partial [Planctomycetota bacterium]
MSDRQESDTPQPLGTEEIPARAFVLMALGAFAVVLFLSVRRTVGMGVVAVLLTDGVMALLVLLAAGGYGFAVYRRLGPAGAPPGLAVSTATAAGLWVLAMAVWAIGSLIGAALSPWVWWPVVLIGVGLALWQLHGPLAGVRMPERFGGYNLIWVLVAAAAALWLAGAVLPAGWLGTLTGLGPTPAWPTPAWPTPTWPTGLWPENDSAVALVRTVQLPREFHDGGGVRALDHNVYSHFPLCGEMLRLLGMCLRGGAGRGAHLATLMGGLFAIPMVAGTFAALRETGFRGWAATVLIATAPWAAYLAGTGRSELAWMCCLTLSVLWLRRWLDRPDGRTAAWIGGLLGVAMGFGYGAALTVAAPVIAVMLAVGVVRVRRLAGVATAALAAVAVFAPWLVRNAAVTGNPVFPLATVTFGRGHWDDETARRWRTAHSLYPPRGPESPEPRQPPGPGRMKRLTALVIEPFWARNKFKDAGIRVHTLLGSVALLIVFVLTLVGMILRPGSPSRWDWAVLSVLVVQIVLWLGLTGPRTPAWGVAACAVPYSLLCAGGLARLSGMVRVPLMGPPRAGGKWGTAPATLLLAATAGLNLMVAGSYLAEDARRPINIARSPEFRAAKAVEGDGRRAALIGEERALHFPANVLYA